MSNMDHAIRYLSVIEKKYKTYFTTNRLKITDCVAIKNQGNTVSVAITNNALPANIKDDIKAMFWI